MSKVELTHNLSIASKKCKNIIFLDIVWSSFTYKASLLNFFPIRNYWTTKKWRKGHCSCFRYFWDVTTEKRQFVPTAMKLQCQRGIWNSVWIKFKKKSFTAFISYSEYCIVIVFLTDQYLTIKCIFNIFAKRKNSFRFRTHDVQSSSWLDLLISKGENVTICRCPMPP